MLFESRRNISSKNLPPIISVNTMVYESDNHLHKYWIDGRQGPLLKPFVELTGQIDGVDDTDVVVYELRVCPIHGISKFERLKFHSSHLLLKLSLKRRLVI